MRNEPFKELELRFNAVDFPSARDHARPWAGIAAKPIPVAVVDVSLPLFGATAPAELLPESPATPGFFEPVVGLAMREMFETTVFANLFGPRACAETLGLWRRR